MSLSFIDLTYYVDASGLPTGLIIPLYYDKNGLTINVSTESFVVTFNDSPTPFSATVETFNENCAHLIISYDQPANNIIFGSPRSLTITGSSGSSCNINIISNYANDLIESNWNNASDITTLENIILSGPLTSTSINNVLKAIYQTALTAYNQVKKLWSYYGFKDKYLADIIDLAVSAGVAANDSTTNVTYNSDGTINTLIVTHNSTRNSQIKLTYGYTSYPVDRLNGATLSVIAGASTNENKLSSLLVDALDGSGNVIYRLATIAIQRAYLQYSNPYLPDYVSGLDITDPNNLLSDYKYYKGWVMTGWMVVV